MEISTRGATTSFILFSTGMTCIISLIMGAWQYQCYFVPTQGSWQRQCYVVPSISNTPDGSKANPMKALTKNPMVFMAHPMASTATGRAVVTKGTASTLTENPMVFMTHPMASTVTGRAVVTKGTASVKNPTKNSNAIETEHTTIANPMLASTTNTMTFKSHPMASIATDSLVVWNILFR